MNTLILGLMAYGVSKVLPKKRKANIKLFGKYKRHNNCDGRKGNGYYGYSNKRK